MTTAPYVLARTFAEAHAFALVDLGLDKGHYRVVNSSGTLKAVRGVDLYLVPGWRQRYDRFAMQSGLRWTRMNVIDVSEERAKAPEPTNDDLETPDDVQLATITDDEAHAFVATEEQAEEPAPKRRRRRCDECGVLVDPDEVDQHAAEHTEAV